MTTYYWVGGAGTWDGTSTTNWATSSGGTNGKGPPTSADAVYFDSNSGTGVCTTAASAAASIIVLNSSNLGLTLGADLSINSYFTFTLGTLSLGSYALTTTAFAGAASGSIAFGTGRINITGNSAAVWNTNNATNFSYTGTGNVYFTYSGSAGTRTIAHGSTSGATESNSPNFYITSGSDIVLIAGAKTIDFTGFSGTISNYARTLYGNLIISSGATVSAGTSATTFAATSGTQQITTNGKTLDFPITFNGVGGTFQLQDNCTVGSTRSVTLTNGTLDLNSNTLNIGYFTSQNTNTRSIAFGTGTINVSGNASTVWSTTTADNFSITGTPTVNFTYASSTGTRNIYWGSVSGATGANLLNVNVTAGSDSVKLQGSFKSVNLTGFSGTIENWARSIYGNLTCASGATYTAGTAITTFAGTSGTQQITTNGKTLDFPITFNGIGGTFAFQDALTQGSTRAFTITNGTVQLKAGVTTTVGAFATSGTNQKYLQSTLAGSQATLSQASGTVGVSYLTIQDINATGGATWNAYYANGNIDGGNNTNWNFGGTPSYDAEYGYKLRSFTETGRF